MTGSRFQEILLRCRQCQFLLGDLRQMGRDFVTGSAIDSERIVRLVFNSMIGPVSNRCLM